MEKGTEIETETEAEAGLILKKAAASPRTLGYPRDYFDVITMLAVAEHIPPSELKPLFMHLRKILKPSGRLIITMPSHSADPILHFLAAINMIPKEKVLCSDKISNYPSALMPNRLSTDGSVRQIYSEF